MSERKVLNKYYPPDFDPSKIPKLRLPRNRQYSIRIMAPFNMKCNTCGEYIYKGKKFNSRKETVEDEDYLGLRIFRFYIKCPRCVAEIAFKTDPQNTDYELEDGATRNFEASKTAERLAEAEAKAIEDEEANNPMKVLENRTKASQREMEMLETLEDLRELNSRHAKVDHENMILMATAYKEQLARLQEEEDEKFINSIFKKEDNIKRLPEDDEDEKVVEPPVKIRKSDKPTDLLAQDSSKSGSGSGAEKKEPASWEKSVGILSKSKTSLAMMVKRKTPSNPATKPASAPTPQTGAAPVAGRSVNGTTESTVGRSKSETSSETVGPSKVDSSNVKTVAPVMIPSSTEQSSSGLSGLGMLGDYSDSDSNGSDDS